MIDPSQKSRRPVLSSKMVLLLPRSEPSTTLGSIPVLTVWKRHEEIFLSQGKYTIEILKRFGMLDCDSMATSMDANFKKLKESTSNSDMIDPTMYRQLIESLIYLKNTILDICFALNTLSQFMSDPTQIHWVSAKHVLRYLHGTVGYGLRYALGCDLTLQVFSDSDLDECVAGRKITSGCCFSLGSAIIS